MHQATLFKALCLAVLFAGTPMPAHAQLAPRLPGSIVESASVGSAERDAINSFIDALSDAALNGEADEAASARIALVNPLRENRPSVSFRQSFAQAASGLISDLVASDDMSARLAGLRLAGYLGTSDTARVIAESLQDANPGVGVFAAVQARRVFEVSSNNGPALTDSQASTLVQSVADAMSTADDRLMAESLIRALGAAAQSRPREMTQTRTSAANSLAQAMSERLTGSDASDLLDMQDPIVIAASSLTRTMSDTGNNVSAEATKAAAGFGGDVLALLLTREIQGTNDATPDADVRLLRAVESLVYFARQRQAGSGGASSVPQTDLAGLLESGSRDFRRELVDLIGPGSSMLAQFGFADDRFIK